MLELRNQIFGDSGYSSDLKLSASELGIFRHHINQHWLSVIRMFSPHLYEEARDIGIENYHLISEKMDHRKVWPKANRVLPQAAVAEIKQLEFMKILKREFGEFTISDIYDTQQHHGEEEIYWRLVRPGASGDVGPLHKDKWFHGALNSGYGMFAENVVTVKIWIAIYCEAGKSGLAIAPGSHFREWKYHIEVEDEVPRPKPDEDLSDAGARLILTEPGSLLIFNEGVLHGGVVNQSDKTRVSAEITMVFDRERLGVAV